MKRKIVSIMAAALILTPALASTQNIANTVAATNYQTYLDGTVYSVKLNDLLYKRTVFFPKEMTTSNKKYPVVVWGNGTFVTSSVYEEILSQIASKGYIVVATNDRFCGAGISESVSVEYIISEGKKSGSVFYNKIDAEHIGSAGHSQGGMSAVNSSRLNSKIDCVFDIQGCDLSYEASQLKVPTFFLTSTDDMVIKSPLVKASYNACKTSCVYASLKNITHFGPVDGHSASLFSEYAVKWFDAFLKNDKSARAVFLNGGKLSKDSRWVNYTSKNF
jgi:dienelactone hydrolase